MNWDMFALIFSGVGAWAAAVSAIVATVAPIRDKKRDRAHSIRMAHVTVYESKNADAIEEYVAIVSDCVSSRCVDERYKRICSKIYLHVDYRYWSLVESIDVYLIKGEYGLADQQLIDFCKLINFADFAKSRLAEEKAEEATKTRRQRRKKANEDQNPD